MLGTELNTYCREQQRARDPLFCYAEKARLRIYGRRQHFLHQHITFLSLVLPEMWGIWWKVPKDASAILSAFRFGAASHLIYSMQLAADTENE